MGTKHASDGDLFGGEPVSIDDVLREAESLAAFGRELTERSEKFIASVRTFSKTPVDDVAPAPKHHPIKACLTHFDQQHRQRLGAPAKIDGAKDSAIMKKLIATYSEEKVCELVDRFFETDDDFTVSRTGFTVGAFSHRVAALISSTAIAPRTSGLTRATESNGRNATVAANMIRNSYGNGNGVHR